VKLSKTLVVPLAGLLLVGLAGAALATSAPAPAAGTGAVVPAAASPSPSTGTVTRPARDGAITEVLDELVAKGTITAAQKTAIVDALEAKRTERQAEREKLRGFLSDGVITKAELDQLPADHPLRQLTTLMDDGQITLDELRSLGKGFMKGFGGGRGEGHGGGMWGGNVPAPTASPTTGG
jgi:hypothetical protein